MFTDLSSFKQLCAEAFIHRLDEKRKRMAESQQSSILGTIEILWLFIGVAFYTKLSSSAAIIPKLQHNDSLNFTISVAAFCKARDAFSQKTSLFLLTKFS